MLRSASREPELVGSRKFCKGRSRCRKVWTGRIWTFYLRLRNPAWEGVDSSPELHFAWKEHIQFSTLSCDTIRGLMRGNKEGTIPRAPDHYGDAESLRGRRKVTTMLQVLSSIQYIYFRKTPGAI